MIKNLIFDVDGTIWNSTAVVAKAWIKAVEDLGLDSKVITPDRLKKEFGKPMNEIFASMFSDVKDEETFNKVNQGVIKYEHDFLETNEEDLTYDGVTEGFHELAKKYNLYIVSNCQKGYIELVCRKTGITDCIKDYLCYGDTLATKDVTMCQLIEKNNLKKDESVYIGDILGDYISTKKAGLKFIHAAYGFGEVDEPDAVAKSFDEIDSAAESLA